MREADSQTDISIIMLIYFAAGGFVGMILGVIYIVSGH